MKVFSNVFFSFLVAIFVAGCSSEILDPVREPVFRLVVLDKNKLPTNEIMEGDSFSIGLELVNNLEDTFLLNYSDYQRIYIKLATQKDFFLIQKLDQSTSDLVDIGRPFKEGFIPDFPEVNLPPFKIAPEGKVLLYSFEWLENPQNRHLQIGKYHSKLYFQIKLETWRSKIGVDTSVDFQIL